MLSLGLLGCADIAIRRVLPAVARVPGIRLAAVASRSLDRARQVTGQFGGQPVAGYAELLARDDIDAVYLPLPPQLHAEWTGRALAAGKHVLAEKPLTTSLADTTRLIVAARAAGLALMENVMFVHHGQHAKIRELVRDGAIGEPRAFAATFAVPPRPPGDIRLRPDLGGGALLDTGGYPIRAAQLHLGGGLSVAGAVLRHDAELGVDTGGSALLRGPDCVAAHVTFGIEHQYRSVCELLGTAGRLVVEHAFSPPADHRPVLHLVDGRHGQRTVVLDPEDQVANTVAAFVRAAAAGVVPDAEVLLAQAQLVEEVRRAAPAPPAD